MNDTIDDPSASSLEQSTCIDVHIPLKQGPLDTAVKNLLESLLKMPQRSFGKTQFDTSPTLLFLISLLIPKYIIFQSQPLSEPELSAEQQQQARRISSLGFALRIHLPFLRERAKNQCHP